MPEGNAMQDGTGPGQGADHPVARWALFVGPIIGLIVLLFTDLEPGRPEVTRAAAVALLMAIWWMTEAVPLAVTALLPVVLLPVLGIMSGKSVAPLYFNHVIFLFIGGFMVALAMERWNLHKRIALRVLLLFGTNPRAILLGFMVATAFLSMWISNTATTMMMVPIVLAVILELEDSLGRRQVRRYAVGLLLGVAYSASLGGIATLVGTPPNLFFGQIFSLQFPDAPEISFVNWFLFAFPIAFVLLGIVWLLLVLLCVPRGGKFVLDARTFHTQYAALGPISFEERVVLADFALLATLWLTRADISLGQIVLPGWSRLFSNPTFVTDGTVAVTMATLLFLVPSRSRRGSRVLDWETATRLPWNIVLLFGGGFALAKGFEESGLSRWLGARFDSVTGFHPLVIIAAICLMITFLTELTSNTATSEILLPILAALSVSIGLNPLLLMIPATLSCSLAFMLPVATPPNVIIFGTARLRIADMARAGLVLNLAGVLIVTLGTWFIVRTVLGIDITQMPDWAVSR
jgi:sodium-dependent dicarboxylate transporter 2/3/5